MTISGKMITGFALVIAIMALANGYVLFELHAVSARGKNTLTSDVQVIDRTKALKRILVEEERNGRKYLVTGDEAYRRLFTDDIDRFAAALDSLETIPHERLEMELIADLRDQHSAIRTSLSNSGQKLTPVVEENLSIALNHSVAGLHETLDRLLVVNQLSIDRSMTAIEQTTERSVQVAYVMLLSTLVLALVAAFVIASTITRPIKSLIRGTREIAKGSFQQVEVRSKDEMSELADAVNEMSSKLQKMEQLRTEMMQHIAHELRTPLTTMITAHYVLSQQRIGPLNAEQMRLLAAIRQNIDRLTDFSYDFLDLAKIEAGMMQYALERTDLVQFVEPLVEEARLAASNKDISVLLDSTFTPEVLIDRKRFSHVVTNLLSNAIKYSNRRGEISVVVSPSEFGARIAVRDRGAGIAPDDLPKVFEKFYRVRSSSGKGTRGSGVGLALVKAVTEAMGGSVSAESTLGAGSTFIVDLPVAPPEVSDADLPRGKQMTQVGHG